MSCFKPSCRKKCGITLKHNDKHSFLGGGGGLLSYLTSQGKLWILSQVTSNLEHGATFSPKCNGSTVIFMRLFVLTAVVFIKQGQSTIRFSVTLLCFVYAVAVVTFKQSLAARMVL